IVGAASVLTDTPARFEPVSETTSIRGSEDNKGPTYSPWPKIMLKTPFGGLASAIISAKIMAERGASSLGLYTMVQPANRAGAILHSAWFMGQFQGVINAATPAAS